VIWVALGVLPWAGLLLYLLKGVRLPRALGPLRPRAGDGEAWPSVTVVIPARNEARNIRSVLASLAASAYPDFEIVVVDDRSTDRTGALARAVPRGNARRLTVVEGAELPDGWLGKPWACWQGAHAATGELVLFTDADTVHGSELLGRAVQAMEDDGAHLFSVAGRQLMLTFWEKLVQPQVFVGMLVRYRDQRYPPVPDRWRDAIVNGQFILVARQVYEELGGHEALRGEVVEDLRMAQRFARRGQRVSLRMAEDDFSTRMYASLPELVEGWSKNIVLGGAATLPQGWLRRWMAPLALAAGVFMWLIPPLVVALAALVGASGGLVLWAWGAVVLSALTWVLASWRFRIAPTWGLLYPLGAAASAYIIWRAWRRGPDVTWRGRSYRVGDVTGEV
jgi:chlorobactene glucosyltransferase